MRKGQMRLCGSHLGFELATDLNGFLLGLSLLVVAASSSDFELLQPFRHGHVFAIVGIVHPASLPSLVELDPSLGISRVTILASHRLEVRAHAAVDIVRVELVVVATATGSASSVSIVLVVFVVRLVELESSRSVSLEVRFESFARLLLRWRGSGS